MTHTLTTYNEAVHTALHILATDMGYEIPPSDTSQERAYLRALMNIRGPAPLPDGYPEAEAIVLDAERERTGTATWENAKASPVHPRMALWRGDITRLEVDAIVNAANSALLGCRAPGHTCIDNAIHSAAGLELRQACAEVMAERARHEGTNRAGFPTSEAALTPGFHLPSRFVIHTVGPIVSGELTDEHREALTRSYRRCLEEAAAHGLNTVAFCCISTGVFGFPQEEAARIAVSTVTDFLDSGSPGASELRVIVDVFGGHDEALYRALLGL
ncbi:macro domain-containing protein [Actinomyces bouchesdurhonensis]|uniref:macro domain-containing protein n=1 Tax=Actinomyces bouchesdurhonensis TaxID=1852361 RepID=UPI0028EBE23E|nr:macro domain-containing protein [Actinomyces bouchesdurhonensis]